MSLVGVIVWLVVCALLWIGSDQIPGPFGWVGKVLVILLAVGWFLRLAHVWTGPVRF